MSVDLKLVKAWLRAAIWLSPLAFVVLMPRFDMPQTPPALVAELDPAAD